MADTEGRNKPREASKNVKTKRDLKKAKKIVKDSLTDMPGFYSALRSTTEEGAKEIEKKKRLLSMIDDAQAKFKGSDSSKGRNVTKRGAVMKARGGTFKGIF
tara:strand:+ start:60 stop:365 length:306 start_codon:yes stop_codon:yes gene_type:complete